MPNDKEMKDDIAEVFDKLSEDEGLVVTEEVEEETTEASADEVIVIEASEETDDTTEEDAETSETVEAAEDEDSTDADSSEGEDEPEEGLDPLAHWKADDKEYFKTLDKPAQEFLIKRDKEFQRQATEKANEAMYIKQDVEHITRALKPIRDELVEGGISDGQAVATLVGAHVSLQKKPAESIRYLMQRYNVSLEQIANPEATPERTEADQRIEHIETRLSAADQRAEMERQAAVNAKIEAFRETAEFWDDVMPEMTKVAYGDRMENPDQLPDVQSVYDRACWMNPEVRAKLQKRDAAQGDKATNVAKSKAAAGAKVRATPVSKTTRKEKPATLGATIDAVWDEVEERDSRGTSL